jgi:hypothetical protein
MRLFVMLFAGLLVLTGPSNAATVSITCHLFAGGPPSNVPSTDNVPLMYVLTLDYLPFAIDDSSHSISSPALTGAKFEVTEFTDKRIVALDKTADGLVKTYTFDRITGLLERISVRTGDKGVQDVFISVCGRTDSPKF